METRSSCSRTAVLGELVQLPEESGGTRCHVSIALRGSSRPVVVVSEAPDNTGYSVSLAFDAIAEHVRRFLPADGPAPVWLERWPERALAALLLHEGRVAATHLMVEQAGGWRRLPLDTWEAARLMSGAAR